VIQRVLTALVGIPLLVTVIWIGAPWLTLLLLLVVILGIWELYRLSPADGQSLPTSLGIIWVMAFVLGGQAATGPSHFLTISLVIFGCGSFLSLLWLVAFFRGPGLWIKTAYLIGGPIYVGFLMGHVLVLRDLGGGDILGRDWVLFALLVTFATDTGAFLVGKAIGRHPMSLRISPNKTWEGAAGGFCNSRGGLHGPRGRPVADVPTHYIPFFGKARVTPQLQLACYTSKGNNPK